LARVSYICGHCRTYNGHVNKCSNCGILPSFAPRNPRLGLIIDGEHSGYYDDALGFPKDPTNPAKSICPSKHKAKDAFARVRDKTRGEVSYE
jgi:hypothetical protein